MPSRVHVNAQPQFQCVKRARFRENICRQSKKAAPRQPAEIRRHSVENHEVLPVLRPNQRMARSMRVSRLRGGAKKQLRVCVTGNNGSARRKARAPQVCGVAQPKSIQSYARSPKSAAVMNGGSMSTGIYPAMVLYGSRLRSITWKVRRWCARRGVSR